MLISGFDEIVVPAADSAAVLAAYERFFGRPAVNGRVETENCAVRVVDGDGRLTVRFATEDPEDAARRLERRGIEVSGDSLSRNGFEFQLGRGEHPPLTEGDVYAVDHIVVRTPNPERAVAMYGGRLGLDLRLEREREQWGSRMHFFRCGDAVLEVVYLLEGAGDPDGPDRVWGTAWRSRDVGATYEWLSAEGFDVTEPKTGRKPGTTVMTVKAPLTVPTLIIGPAA